MTREEILAKLIGKKIKEIGIQEDDGGEFLYIMFEDGTLVNLWMVEDQTVFSVDRLPGKNGPMFDFKLNGPETKPGESKEE